MKDKEERPTNNLTPQFKEAGHSVGFDPSKFLHFFEDSDLSEVQKTELLHDLWKIVNGFVQLGFGVHPVQQAMPDAQVCGKLPDDNSVLGPDLLYCDDSNKIGDGT